MALPRGPRRPRGAPERLQGQHTLPSVLTSSVRGAGRRSASISSPESPRTRISARASRPASECLAGGGEANVGVDLLCVSGSASYVETSRTMQQRSGPNLRGVEGKLHYERQPEVHHGLRAKMNATGGEPAGVICRSPAGRVSSMSSRRWMGLGPFPAASCRFDGIRCQEMILDTVKILAAPGGM